MNLSAVKILTKLNITRKKVIIVLSFLLTFAIGQGLYFNTAAAYMDNLLYGTSDILYFSLIRFAFEIVPYIIFLIYFDINIKGLNYLILNRLDGGKQWEFINVITVSMTSLIYSVSNTFIQVIIGLIRYHQFGKLVTVNIVNLTMNLLIYTASIVLIYSFFKLIWLLLQGEALAYAVTFSLIGIWASLLVILKSHWLNILSPVQSILVPKESILTGVILLIIIVVKIIIIQKLSTILFLKKGGEI